MQPVALPMEPAVEKPATKEPMEIKGWEWEYSPDFSTFPTFPSVQPLQLNHDGFQGWAAPHQPSCNWSYYTTTPFQPFARVDTTDPYRDARGRESYYTTTPCQLPPLRSGITEPSYTYRAPRGRSRSRSRNRTRQRLDRSRSRYRNCSFFNSQKDISASRCGPVNGNKQTLYVRYLPNHWNDNQLYDLFSLCGNVVKSHIPRDPYGFSRGYGFILFSSEADAAHSLHKLNDFVIENHKLLVKYAYKPMPPHLLTGR